MWSVYARVLSETRETKTEDDTGGLMVIFIDPQTRQRISFDKRSGDVQYDLVGDEAISEETVPLIGPWEDYTGSDINVNSRSQQMFAGLSNELFGTDPWVQGAKVGALGIVGQNTQTTRRRVIKRRVRFDKNKAGVIIDTRQHE